MQLVCLFVLGPYLADQIIVEATYHYLTEPVSFLLVVVLTLVPHQGVQQWILEVILLVSGKGKVHCVVLQLLLLELVVVLLHVIYHSLLLLLHIVHVQQLNLLKLYSYLIYNSWQEMVAWRAQGGLEAVPEIDAAGWLIWLKP